MSVVSAKAREDAATVVKALGAEMDWPAVRSMLRAAADEDAAAFAKVFGAMAGFVRSMPGHRINELMRDQIKAKGLRDGKR